MTLDHRIRIIGGFLKGRKLEVIDLEGLRPTTDRARETVFNWIGHQVEGASVLDLFAGSGALGLESYSRGATHVVLVEKDPHNAALLKTACQALPLLPQLKAQDRGSVADKAASAIQVHQGDALAFLQQCPQGQGFDLIFLDPPFASDLLEPAIKLLVERDLIAANGLLYIEMSKNKKKPLFGLSMIREEVMGASHCGLYQKSFFL